MASVGADSVRHLRLDGRVVIVTGAAGHLGSTGARILHDLGAHLVLTDRNADVETLAEGLSETGAPSIGLVADITVETEVAEIVGAAMDTFGRVDGLWNNAARLDSEWLARDTNVVDIELDVLLGSLQVDLVGPALLCKYAIPHMVRRRAGSIVNVSSIGAQGGDDVWCAYGSAKAALEYLTRHIATAFGHVGVRCNTVIPGYVPAPGRTGRTSFGSRTIRDHQALSRAGTPQDIANVVAFLLSDAAAFVTGQAVAVDGGVHIHQPWLRDRRDAVASTSTDA